MGNRDLQIDAKNYGIGRVYCSFVCTTNGGSAPLLTTVDGADVVASISRSSAGVLVFTLKDSYPKVVFASADIDDAAGTGEYATVRVTATSPVTLTVTTRAVAGAATDYAGRALYVNLEFKNSNMTQMK